MHPESVHFYYIEKNKGQGNIMLQMLQDLIHLQTIDDQLAQIQKKMGNLPELVNVLKTEIQEESDKIKSFTDTTTENQTLIVQNEGKIVDYKAQLEKFQEQLYLVTTNREYDALTSEIDYAKKMISDAEEAILNSDELITQMEENIKIAEVNISELKEKLKVAEKNLKETIEATKKEKNQLDKSREASQASIPKKYLTTYNRIRKARKGIAVVPMQREACSGCHNRIIPQKRVEIQKSNKIIFCDVCGRFIYFDHTK